MKKVLITGAAGFLGSHLWLCHEIARNQLAHDQGNWFQYFIYTI